MKCRFLLAGLLLAAGLLAGCSNDDGEKPQPEQPAPVLTTAAPTIGGPGTLVTLTGNNFGTAKADVAVTAIHGTSAVETALPADSIKEVTATQLKFRLPRTLALGQYAFKVAVKSKSATKTSAFEVVAQPTVSGVEYNTMVPGQSMVIMGSNFSPTAGNNDVRLGTTVLTVTAATATQLTVTLPAATPLGIHTLVVSVSGVASNADKTVEVVAAPTVTALTPTSGFAGTSVTITGTSFSNPVVKFGTVTAHVSANSGSSITCTVPAGLTVGTAYTVSVTSNRITVNAPQQFTVEGAPVITGLSATSQFIDDEIEINGTGLATGVNSETVVLVGTRQAEIVSYSATQLRIKIPRVVHGEYSVTVRVKGVASNSDKKVFAEGFITGINTHNGNENTDFIIQGRGFNTVANNTELVILACDITTGCNMVGMAIVTSVTETEVRFRLPTGLTPMQRYEISESVLNADGVTVSNLSRKPSSSEIYVIIN